jgi:hypothetical protein
LREAAGVMQPGGTRCEAHIIVERRNGLIASAHISIPVNFFITSKISQAWHPVNHDVIYRNAKLQPWSVRKGCVAVMRILAKGDPRRGVNWNEAILAEFDLPNGQDPRWRGRRRRGQA